MQVGELTPCGAQVGQDLIAELTDLPAGNDAYGNDVEQGAQRGGHGRGQRGLGGRQGLIKIKGDQPRDHIVRRSGQCLRTFRVFRVCRGYGVVGVGHGRIVPHLTARAR